MSFNDFIQKYKLKNKATSNIKLQQVLGSIALDNVGIYVRDGPFSNDIGVENLHPSEGTHWVAYINEKYFDSYGCCLPQKLCKLIEKRIRHCLFSEFKIHGKTSKRDSFCESYCLYLKYLTKVLQEDMESAVLNIYYQRFF